MAAASLPRSCLVAYFVGSIVGIASFLIESAVSTSPVLPESLAAYGLLGGALGAGARGLLGIVLPTRTARAATLLVISGFGSLDALYWLNVRILPGEHYLSFRSLVADSMVVGVLLALALGLALASPHQRTRDRWDARMAAAGVSLFAAALGTLAWRWPASTPDPARQGSGPNLVLIVLDSTRRDHLGLHGYARPTSPSIDALARQARIFDRAHASSSWTVPAVTSILTSRLSPEAGGPAALQEQLVSRGYVTACFTDNPHLGREADLMDGFDRVERSVGSWRRLFRRTVLGDVLERLDPGNDRRLVGRAIAWVAGTRGPFFLYVHLMDSHTPYTSPPIDGKRREGRRIDYPVSGMEVTPDEAEDIVARYDGGIRSADAQVAKVLGALESAGRPYLAIITADHGESLGESGRWFHGGSLAPELLAVPLLILGSDVKPTRVETPVGHAAIHATLLAAAGIPCSGCSGFDLRSGEGTGVVEGGLPPDLFYRIAAGHKLIFDRRGGHSRLFDLRADPGETHEVEDAFPGLVGAMTQGLARGEAKPTPADVEHLRSLGYAGS